MSSNMQAGERRWASARRGGMTVLGKVAVPKPVNLPSQRLENHGVDPSVEIVPKGTIGWGSRPSSSGSNAWVSASQSPNADGRPSSGGSGTTRPSTAGSCDRTHESISSAWGPNSRPSSASGALASTNSSSTPLRPKSAETRPNSSQLSRFAETVSESSVVWCPNSAAERLGEKSSKGDGFSLSSGDFPTLGTEKQMENLESQQDHGRPSSASGRVTSLRENAIYHTDPKSGVVNTWRPAGSQSEEDSFHPGSEKWPAEPPQYFNPSIPPQHFDAWRGPPVSVPPGGWYRGPPRGPAFGGPGGFPMEPFPYYRSQVPPPGGPRPRGPHTNNGEFYQGPPGPPHMPEYARPGMPLRPGFYQGPPGPRAFEGYYGPPMGYHMNERDMPYMGHPAGPPVYNCYPGPGPNGPSDDAVSHPRNKQIDRKEEEENWQHNEQTRRNNERGADDDDAEREISVMKRPPSDNSSLNLPYRDGGMHVNVNDDGWTNKSASPSTFPPQALQLSVSRERELPLLPPPNKDPVLMQKIEGLNAKPRNGQNTNFNANNNAAGAYIPREMIGSGRENQIRPIDIFPRTHHGGQSRGKFNNQEHDGQRKPITPGFSGAAKSSNMESALGVHVHASSLVGKAVEKHSVSSIANSEAETVAEAYDSTDIQAQRAKMRELAKQRAHQLQKEEEERIKDQKAKALAKLEELNRRTKTGESAIGQADKVVDKREGEEPCRPVDISVVDRGVKSKAGKSDEVSENSQAADSFSGLSQNQDPSISPGSESDIAVDVPLHLPADPPQKLIIQSNVSRGHTLPVNEHSLGDDRNAVVHVNDGATSMHKQTGYKPKQQKTFNEKSVPDFLTEAYRSDTGVADVDITSMVAPESVESDVRGVSNTVTSTTPHRKKVNKSGKNKHKLEENQASSAPAVASDKNVEKKSIPDSKAPSATAAVQTGESESRSINNGKQPIQRTARSQQAKKYSDKAHGSEVIWAPVRTHDKPEDSVETNEKKSTRESSDLVKSDNVAQNTFKGKRAEMERFIPKPVAKELAQQVSVPFPPEVSVMVQFGSVDFESTQIISSTNASFGSVSLDIKERDSRHNKNKNEHGHLQQGAIKHSQTHEPKRIEQSQSVTSDKSSANSEINASGNVDADMYSNTITVGAVSRSAFGKEHGATGRGKRRMAVPKGTRNNPVLENDNTVEMHGSSVKLAARDVNYNDRTVNIREHLGAGERTSQWKPKSHANSMDNHHQSDKPVESETVMNKLPKKVQPSQWKVHVHDSEESSNIGSFHDSEEPMPGHHQKGFNREKKPIPTKGRHNFPNQVPVVPAESDFRRHGGQSNRYTRDGHEFYGDRPSGKDYRPQNFQRQGQYEYQPVGHTKDGNLEKHDELTDGGNRGGQRFQERGHNQSKHGGHNFARQGGGGRVESGQH